MKFNEILTIYDYTNPAIRFSFNSDPEEEVLDINLNHQEVYTMYSRDTYVHVSGRVRKFSLTAKLIVLPHIDITLGEKCQDFFTTLLDIKGKPTPQVGIIRGGLQDSISPVILVGVNISKSNYVNKTTDLSVTFGNTAGQIESVSSTTALRPLLYTVKMDFIKHQEYGNVSETIQLL